MCMLIKNQCAWTGLLQYYSKGFFTLEKENFNVLKSHENKSNFFCFI